MTVIHYDLISGALSDIDMPRIGYTNLFRDGTVTASSEAVDHPKELAFDGFTYDGWLSTGGATEWLSVQLALAQSANYMAIAVHNLTGCTVTPQRSTNGTVWTNLDSPYVVLDNRPIIWEFASVSDVYWRLLIQNAVIPVTIGAIHVGLKLVLQRPLPIGWRPPDLNQDIKYTNSISEGGQTLGRSVIRRGVKTSISSRNVEYVWAKQDWQNFLAVADQYAIFFWLPILTKAEIIYGGVSDPAESNFSSGRFLSTEFKIAGITR